MRKREPNFAAQRQRMVRRQLRGRDITDQRVLEAMATVPREEFIPSRRHHEAYGDFPVPIGHEQTISQPYVVALMVQELGVQPHHRVLDVGAGSGYQTAILASLAQHVFAVERIVELTEGLAAALDRLGIANVTATTADGTLGWAEHAPFDRIICGAAGPEVPAAWIDQLADGGRIVMPVGDPHVQTLIAVDKCAGQAVRRDICPVRFVRLIGEQGW